MTLDNQSVFELATSVSSMMEGPSKRIAELESENAELRKSIEKCANLSYPGNATKMPSDLLNDIYSVTRDALEGAKQ